MKSNSLSAWAAGILLAIIVFVMPQEVSASADYNASGAPLMSADYGASGAPLTSAGYGTIDTLYAGAGDGLYNAPFMGTFLGYLNTSLTGTGDGTKDRPYSGEWQVTELVKTLKVGDYLGYDCVLKHGWIYVTDDILKEQFVTNFLDWSVSDPIDASPWEAYLDYCRYNDLMVRKGHTFLITELKVSDGTSSQPSITIKGHYSGAYTDLPGTKDNPYTGIWQAEELVKVLNRGDYLSHDCVIRHGAIYITNNDDGTAVMKNAHKVTIAPTRAYFVGPSIEELTGNGGELSTSRLSIVIDGEESGLQLVINDAVPGPGSKSYTLFGTEAGEGYQGIVIRNGKVVKL